MKDKSDKPAAEKPMEDLEVTDIWEFPELRQEMKKLLREYDLERDQLIQAMGEDLFKYYEMGEEDDQDSVLLG